VQRSSGYGPDSSTPCASGAIEEMLRHVCARAGCAPFFVRDRFDPRELTRWLLETPA
jgi:hypothetical protein